MERITVRAPVADDAEAMGTVHCAAWRVGYRGLLPDAFLDGLSADRSAANWTATLSGDHPAEATAILAEVGTRVAGICSFGAYRPVEAEVTPADLCELWMLNVHPDFWGTGVAQELMGAAVTGLRRQRSETRAALWVLDGNARGRRFYEKEGWSADGGSKVDTIGDREVVEVRYSRSL